MFNVGDILIYYDGDFLEYLGEGKVKWVTFGGELDHDFVDRPIRLITIEDSHTIRKTTKLERALR